MFDKNTRIYDMNLNFVHHKVSVSSYQPNAFNRTLLFFKIKIFFLSFYSRCIFSNHFCCFSGEIFHWKRVILISDKKRVSVFFFGRVIRANDLWILFEFHWKNKIEIFFEPIAFVESRIGFSVSSSMHLIKFQVVSMTIKNKKSTSIY